MKGELKKWNKEEFGYIEESIKECEEKLEELDNKVNF